MRQRARQAGLREHPLLVLLLQHVLVHEVLLLEQQLLMLLQGCLLLHHIVWRHPRPWLHPSTSAWLAWRLLHSTQPPLQDRSPFKYHILLQSVSTRCSSAPEG